MSGYDILSPIYDVLAKLIFGNSIEKATVHYFHQIDKGDRVLIIGGGTGWILEELNEKGPKVVYVELSRKMINRAKGRKTDFQVEFVHGSYDTVPPGVYDVIITPFFLDQFTTVTGKNIITLLLPQLSKSGRWLFSDFVKPQNQKQKLLMRAMFLIFGLLCSVEAKMLPDYNEIFNGRLQKHASKSFFNGMIESRWYQF